VNDWEIIADNLSKAGWSWDCVSTIDSNRRMIPTGEQSGLQTRTVTTESVSLRADEKLTAFLEEPCAVVFNRAQKVTALDERAALA
jgi:hypothetical protein